MDIRIKTADFTMTSETSSYLDDKLAAIERLVGEDPTARCEVEIARGVGHSQQGNVWKAEIVLSRGSERLRAVAQEESINAAIDIVKDEMLQQLRKSNGRYAVLSRRAGAKLKAWLRFGRD